MAFIESAFTHLECPVCAQRMNQFAPRALCDVCKTPLLARYAPDEARKTLTRDALRTRPAGIWRWAELLPVRALAHRLSLGEGDTPLLPAQTLGRAFGMKSLFVKDESANPAGSVAARGMAVAVGAALEAGAHNLVNASSGGEGAALAVYAARARARAHVFMPQDSPKTNQIETNRAGARLHLVEGSLAHTQKQAATHASNHNALDVSPFCEPFALEGYKTLGFELAQAFDWRFPGVVLCPEGHGATLLGLWKAFAELQELGLVEESPRLVCIQAAGCAPLARATSQGSERISGWAEPQSLAAELCVDAPLADQLILRAIQSSQGAALAVTDDEMRTFQREMAAQEGILLSFAGAAALAGLQHLLSLGWVRSNEQVVLINPSGGLKTLGGLHG